MATNILTDNNISDTYLGLMHGSGEAFPASGQKSVYDGAGNKLAISVGRDGIGVFVSGPVSNDSTGSFGQTTVTALTAAGIKYPTSDGTTGSWLRTNGNNQLFFSNSIPLSSLASLSPSPAGTYSNPSSVTVNSAGLVTSITSGTGSSSSSVYLYVTPILIYSNSVSGDVSTTVGPVSVNLNTQPNRPTGATHAILLIEAKYRAISTGTKDNYVAVNINNFNAVTAGIEQYSAGTAIFNGQRNTTEYKAKLTGTSFTVSIDYLLQNASETGDVNIWLLGFGNYTTLSNS